MFLDGTSGQALLYLDARLENRVTFLEWEKILMGPVKDTSGVEQGGTYSSDQYKLYNNEQFTTAQESKFGVDIGPLSISCVGEADDSVLFSTDIHQLGHLLQLTMAYCKKYKVEMTPEKTKLQVFSPPSLKSYTNYMKAINYLSINGVPLSFTDNTEHVGIIRSSASQNLPHILKRISSHKKSLGAVLSAGLARSHRGNPAASLRIEKLYSFPVLMSGVAPLLLLQSEEDALSQHYKETLQGLQKLYQLTPRPVVYFLAGSLPLPALLHIRQLGLFVMIAKQPGNILHTLAKYLLTSLPDSVKCWFIKIKELCYMYGLPHPLSLLHGHDDLDREAFKQQVKLNVQEYWQQKLRKEAEPLDSLIYFNPRYMSLTQPHPLWTTCGSNSYEVNKACVQAKYLSGRFRTDTLLNHFSRTNSKLCQLHPEDGEVGDLVHHLLLCPVLADRREMIFEYWETLVASSQPCKDIINFVKSAPITTFMQFILDCSVMPQVISAKQIHGDSIHKILFKASRTYCYSMYRERLKRLDRWN